VQLVSKISNLCGLNPDPPTNVTDGRADDMQSQYYCASRVAIRAVKRQAIGLMACFRRYTVTCYLFTYLWFVGVAVGVAYVTFCTKYVR